MNHEDCERCARAVLAHFKFEDTIRYSIGTFDGNWDALTALVDEWWRVYKVWEAQDTLASAYREKRLTVKGTSTMDLPIQAHTVDRDPQKRYAEDAKWEKATTFTQRIVKTNASIAARMNPDFFAPSDGQGGFLPSRKTELGYHDLSALILNPQENISSQQYKGRGDISPDQVYVFMPLSNAIDQAVYQNINTLAKANRHERGGFYNTVRMIRSRMTRIKLAAEHDMAVAFINVGPTDNPKFKYSLISQTDISVRDEGHVMGVPAGTFKCKLTSARFEDALKGSAVTGKDRQDLSERLRRADLFDKEYLPAEFHRKVTAAVTPTPPKSKWSKETPVPELVKTGAELILAHINPKTKQTYKTTPGIFAARQNAALNFQSLILGEIMRYGEVTVAYRNHAGVGEHSFPKFATFDKQNNLWSVGTIDSTNNWHRKLPEETFLDRPT